MIKKGDIYKCYCINGCGEKINQGLFKIIIKTEKTIKIQQLEKGFFDYLNLRKDIINYKLLYGIGYFIDPGEEDNFLLYIKKNGIPFIFEKSCNY